MKSLLSASMHDSFVALLQSPTANRYKRVRKDLLSAGLPHDFTLRLASLEKSLLLGEFNSAAVLFEKIKTTGLLSLKLHRIAGMLALAQEDHSRAQLHKFAYDALRTAILATGTGTRKRPYLITYPADAHELIMAQGFTVKSQSLVEVGQHRYDVLLCEDEREFWFAVTDLFPSTPLAKTRRRRPGGTVTSVAPPKNKPAVSRSGR